MKQCNACGEEKPLTDYYKRSDANTYQGRCKPCYLVATNASRLKLRYGITPDEREELLTKQGGVCAICERPETVRHHKGTTHHLSVDHDHESGAVRGLLCHDCNTGIGKFQDDPVVMQKAIEYLETYERT